MADMDGSRESKEFHVDVPQATDEELLAMFAEADNQPEHPYTRQLLAAVPDAARPVAFR